MTKMIDERASLGHVVGVKDRSFGRPQGRDERRAIREGGSPPRLVRMFQAKPASQPHDVLDLTGAISARVVTHYRDSSDKLAAKTQFRTMGKAERQSSRL